MDFMMMFDQQFSQKGLLCLESILAHSSGSRVFVLCLEDQVADPAETMGGIPLLRKNLEERFPSIGRTSSERPWAPYVRSLRPFLPEYIYSEYGDADALTFVDVDLYFWGDAGVITQEFGDHSFMVTSYGIQSAVNFDSSLFCCRSDRDSLAFLTWWQTKCKEWCLWGPGPNGAYTDEGYLNVIRDEPGTFTGIHVCSHPGINVAPWNVNQYDLQQTEGVLTVDEQPLVCYQYRGYTKTTEEFQAPEGIDPTAASLLYEPYHALLSIEE
jgi:hypothetical protein